MMHVRNLTPHAIDLCEADGGRIERIEPDGVIARVSMGTADHGRSMTIGTREFSVIETSVGKATGLPDPQEGVILIVSRLVAEVAGRHDLIFPHDLSRDDTGAVIGCRAFATIARDPQQTDVEAGS